MTLLKIKELHERSEVREAVIRATAVFRANGGDRRLSHSSTHTLSRNNKIHRRYTAQTEKSGGKNWEFSSISRKKRPQAMVLAVCSE